MPVIDRSLIDSQVTIEKQARTIRKLEKELAVAKKYWAECRERLTQAEIRVAELADLFGMRDI